MGNAACSCVAEEFAFHPPDPARYVWALLSERGDAVVDGASTARGRAAEGAAAARQASSSLASTSSSLGPGGGSGGRQTYRVVDWRVRHGVGDSLVLRNALHMLVPQAGVDGCVRHVRAPVPRGRAMDLLCLPTADRRVIPAVHIRSERLSPFAGGDPTQAPITVVYSHGNAVDLGLCVPYLCALAEAWGVDIVAYDYGGYGITRQAGQDPEEAAFGPSDPGLSFPTKGLRRCSEAMTLHDLRACVAYLEDACGLMRWRDIILYGTSLGTGPTAKIAADACHRKAPFRGVVVQAPLMSGVHVFCGRPPPLSDAQRSTLPTAAMAMGAPSPGDAADDSDSLLAGQPSTGAGCWPMCLYPCDIFRSYAELHRLTCPVLVVHGTEDRVVPCAHGLSFAREVPGAVAPLILKGAGHNDIEELFFETLIRRLKRFCTIEAAP